jgi:multiple sugar transport system permease protein
MTLTQAPATPRELLPEDQPPRRPSRRRSGVAGYAFLSPWILGLIVLTVGPMITSLYLSFTDYDLFTSPEWVGLANFERMVDDPRFLQSVKVTALYVLVTVPLKLVLALAVALLLNSLTRGSAFFRSAFYAPSLLGASVAVALVWRAMFSDDGLVNSALAAVGIDAPSWIDDPSYALWTIILLGVWQFGAPMVIFLAGLKQVPGEVIEAATLDGAGPWRRFRHVVLPLITPLVLFNLVLETIHAFQAFTPAFVISGGRGGPADSTLFYTLYLYERGFGDFQMGYASAMAWVLLLVIAVVTALLFLSARRWVFYSDEGS